MKTTQTSSFRKILTGLQPNLEGSQSLSAFTEGRPHVFPSASAPDALTIGTGSWTHSQPTWP